MYPSSTCKGLRFFCVLLTLLFLQALLIYAPAQASTPTVKVSKVYSATVGSTAEVVISVENPSGMAGFQFELTYDPKIVVAKNITKGPSLPGSAPIANMANANRGSIRVAWMDLSPVNNSMELCRISFDVLAQGSTSVELKGLELVGLDGTLPSQAENGSISTQAGSTPSPAPDPKPDPKPDPDPPQLSISNSQTLPHAQVDRSYSVTLNAANGNRPYTWELKSGELPKGLELDKESGRISGTAEKSGSHNFTIKVTDKDNKTAYKQFTLWVSDGSPSKELPGFDFSKFNVTGAVTFKDLVISQGSMEVRLTPSKMPFTMVVDRNTVNVNLLVNLYSDDDKVYINNKAHNGPGSKSVILQRGHNDITIRVISDDQASRHYTVTVFKLP